MPAPWSWRSGVGERSRMVTTWPRRLRTMPVRRPPREPPTIIAFLEVDMTQFRILQFVVLWVEELWNEGVCLRDADPRHQLRPTPSLKCVAIAYQPITLVMRP